MKKHYVIREFSIIWWFLTILGGLAVVSLFLGFLWLAG